MMFILISCHGPLSVSNRWSFSTFFSVILYYIDIFGILEHIFWCNFVFLATSSSSWLAQAFFVVLDVLHLLVCSFSIGFALVFFGCLKYIFFLPCRLLCFLSMLILLLFLISFAPSIPWRYSFRFHPIIWFFLPLSFLKVLSILLLCLFFLFRASFWASWCPCYYLLYPPDLS